MTWTTEAIGQARAQVLAADGAISLSPAGWLSRSYQDPEGFLLAQIRYLGALSAPLKSHPGQGFDLFYDLVARHPVKQIEVLRSYHRRAGWSVLTLDDLLARSTRLAGEWLRRGVTAGTSVAVVLPMSAELFVAIAAGLRIGVLLVPIPPRGPLLTGDRLALVAPAFVYTTSLYLPLVHRLGFSDEQLLIDEPPTMSATRHIASHAYAPGDAAFCQLTQLHAAVGELRAVSCDAVLAGALRDLLFCFALEPGDRWLSIAPHPEQYLPSLLVASLLGGLCLVHITPEDLRSNPRALTDVNARLLLANHAALQHLLSQPRGALPKLEVLLRDPLEIPDVTIWQRLREVQGWEKLPFGNLIYDSALGGSVLFSARQRLQTTNHVLPSPGLAYTLQAPEGAGQAIGSAGFFSPAEDEPGFIALGRLHDQFMYGGQLPARRDGRVYPEATALKAIGTLPFVDGAGFVTVPAGDGSGRTQLSLVVLCGPESTSDFDRARSERIEQIDTCLRAELGDAFLPDDVELFPLLARRTEGVVDPSQLRWEFENGVMYRKSRSALLRSLHRFRQACRLAKGADRAETPE